MDEANHYDAILETYRKQEIILEEKCSELERTLSKHQDAVKKLENLRQEYEEKQIEYTQKQFQMSETIQTILGLCEENSATWEEVKRKQDDFFVSRDKLEKSSENQINMLQGTSKDLKQLDIDNDSDNIKAKIEDFRSKIKETRELLLQRKHEYENISEFDFTSTDYYLPAELVEELYNEENSTQSLSEINAEIQKVRKNINTINLKAKELEEQI